VTAGRPDAVPDVTSLRADYLAGRLTPDAVVSRVLGRIEATRAHHAWIAVFPEDTLRAAARRLVGRDPAALPLYGVPFAVKDNIDVAGLPTTAGCPAFAYRPERSAAVVERLVAAGAIAVGKTNLDQFATGLAGTRSPDEYGVCRNSFDPAYIAGGSSSGSAVAVALGAVSFSLGTDTAGSGRVPAAFNNLIGLKPTRGLLSTRGVVPACRTLDTVSVFTLTADDADRVLAAAAAFDPEDAYSRPNRDGNGPGAYGSAPRRPFAFGVPRPQDLEFFGDAARADLFARAVSRLEALGGRAVPVDLRPFREAARLLYDGPWVAERYAAIRAFIERTPQALLPVTRGIIEPARERGAVEVFEGQYRLEALRRHAAGVLSALEFLVTPTAGTVYTVDEVLADPVGLNTDLGYYTNFVNLLDLAAVAVPSGFDPRGLPFGVTLCGPAFSDRRLLNFARDLQQTLALSPGATGGALPPTSAGLREEATLRLVVCGAHMSGLALSHELTARGGRRVAAARTAPRYRLFALPGGPPQRPGLVRDERGGAEIEVEVWTLPLKAVGGFLTGVPSPLVIGRVELADGTREAGFLCEGHAVRDAPEITHLGGWRAYLASLA
jgi:allophanate hydrolase